MGRGLENTNQVQLEQTFIKKTYSYFWDESALRAIGNHAKC